MSGPSRRVPSGGAGPAPPSVVFDDSSTAVRSSRLGVPGSSGSQRLRPAGSRFSLHDQFATTRKEYEFGFDDASTVGSGSVRGIELDDSTTFGAAAKESALGTTSSANGGGSQGLLQRDYYELLCLDRRANLTPEQVEAASRRLRRVLGVDIDSQSPQHQRQAAYYLGLVDAATDTLAEPARRLGYDLAAAEETDSGSDQLTLEELVDNNGAYSSEDEETYQTHLEEQYVHLTREEAKASSGLSLRFNASSLFDSHSTDSSHHGPGQGDGHGHGHGSGLQPLDFALQKSHTTHIPSLKKPVENAVRSIHDFFAGGDEEYNDKRVAAASPPPNIKCSTPSLTIKGTTHGLLDAPSKLAPIVVDMYQPPGPTYQSRKHLDRLLSSGLVPVLSLSTKQEISWRDHKKCYPPSAAASHKPPKDLIVEQELELVPHLQSTTRVGHSIPLFSSEPLHVEFSTKKTLGHHGKNKLPSFGVALHQQVGENTAFVVADTGNWRGLLPGKSGECADLTKYIKPLPSAAAKGAAGEKSGGIGGMIPMIEPFRSLPFVEVGYSFGRHEEDLGGMGMQAGEAMTKQHERGMVSLENEMSKRKSRSGNKKSDDDDGYGEEEDDTSSWTISAALTPGNAATYLRYGMDLFGDGFWASIMTPPWSSSSSKKAAAAAVAAGGKKKKSGFRAEIELAGTAQKDFFLAMRVLRSIGRYTKLGLEVGLSPFNLHLSVYWSRLGQRISLPFLVASGSKSRAIGTRILFWTSVFPFAAFAAWELYVQKKKKDKMLAAAATTKKQNLERAKEALAEYVAKKRKEADDAAVVLAPGVETRQIEERRKGGLVILSAKYGARDAVPQEVADVTVAVAALVGDDGKLVIPKGLKKGKLLGFWDPAPTSTKVLRVRYLWQGRESVVEVSGNDELKLP